MGDIQRDVSYTLRTVRRQPGFALSAVLTLTLGIGANTAIFSVVNAVVLRPLKAPDAGTLVRFMTMTGPTSTSIAGVQSFDVWQRQTNSFEDVSAHRLEYVNLTEGTEPEQIPVARVSAGFFRLVRAPLQGGRAFTTSEDRPGGPAVAVLSHALWTRRFLNDPAISAGASRSATRRTSLSEYSRPASTPSNSIRNPMSGCRFSSTSAGLTVEICSPLRAV